MFQNPTYKKPIPPNLQTLLAALKREIKKEINCAKVGVIQSFDAATQTAVIEIAQLQVTSISADGTQTLSPYPLLANVPVYFPAGGGFTMTFPIAAGDECLVVFNDRQIDNWLANGAGLAPTIGRIHDLSDGFAYVGVRSAPRALADVSTTAAQLRSDDGDTLVEVSSGKIQLIADEVVIHGRNKTTFDAGGTGFVYTPGAIDTYTDGVPSNHHAPTPPEVPT